MRSRIVSPNGLVVRNEKLNRVWGNVLFVFERRRLVWNHVLNTWFEQCFEKVLCQPTHPSTFSWKPRAELFLLCRKLVTHSFPLLPFVLSIKLPSEPPVRINRMQRWTHLALQGTWHTAATNVLCFGASHHRTASLTTRDWVNRGCHKLGRERVRRV